MDFPFELRGDRIWVEAGVKGAVRSGILDTGADGTAIDQGLSEELGLKRGHKQSATLRAGGVGVVKTDPIEFRIGNASLTADEANILPLSTHINGLNFILGFDALRKMPFTIDYPESLLKLGSMPKGVSMRFVLGKDIRPMTELKVGSARITAMLDTGSGVGISFPLSWVKKNLAGLPLDEPQKRAILGLEYESQRFILEEILLGGTRLVKIEAQSAVAEEDLSEDKENEIAEIGNPVLRMLKQVGIDGELRMITFVR